MYFNLKIYKKLGAHHQYLSPQKNRLASIFIHNPILRNSFSEKPCLHLILNHCNAQFILTLPVREYITSERILYCRRLNCLKTTCPVIRWWLHDPALTGSRRCYKLFINYIMRLRFIPARRDPSFVISGSCLPGRNFHA